MAAPVEFPSDCAAYMNEDESRMWRKLNEGIGGHPEFQPVVIKGAYVVGTVYSNIKSIVWLCKHRDGPEITYVPRYLLLATCIELLGRCVEGVTDPRKSTLLEGLFWLFNTQDENENAPVLETPQAKYTIADLAAMRNFAAHGQAVSSRRAVTSKFAVPDEKLLDELRTQLQKCLSSYWDSLKEQENVSLCQNLAKASIEPINPWRILTAWQEFQKQSPELSHRSIETILAAI